MYIHCKFWHAQGMLEYFHLQSNGPTSPSQREWQGPIQGPRKSKPSPVSLPLLPLLTLHSFCPSPVPSSSPVTPALPSPSPPVSPPSLLSPLPSCPSPSPPVLLFLPVPPAYLLFTIPLHSNTLLLRTNRWKRTGSIGCTSFNRRLPPSPIPTAGVSLASSL